MTKTLVARMIVTDLDHEKGFEWVPFVRFSLIPATRTSWTPTCKAWRLDQCLQSFCHRRALCAGYRRAEANMMKQALRIIEPE